MRSSSRSTLQPTRRSACSSRSSSRRGNRCRTGDTYTKFVQGQNPGAYQWQLTLSQDQNDVENSLQWAPVGTGTLKFDALGQLLDGSRVGHYKFTISNGGGGTITGEGVGKWT